MDFDALEAVLAQAAAPAGAAECHGALTGWLASGLGEDPSPLLDALLDTLDGQASATIRCREQLVSCHGEIGRQFDSMATLFAPLLPSDDHPLPLRAAALGEWCEGFLFGLGLAGDAAARGGEEVREIIQDFAQIARAGLDDEAGSEADEVAYTELVEFLRAGAQLLRESLAAAPPHSHPLH